MVFPYLSDTKIRGYLAVITQLAENSKNIIVASRIRNIQAALFRNNDTFLTNQTAL